MSELHTFKRAWPLKRRGSNNGSAQLKMRYRVSMMIERIEWREWLHAAGNRSATFLKRWRTDASRQIAIRGIV
jgi:hypothetical protein